MTRKGLLKDMYHYVFLVKTILQQLNYTESNIIGIHENLGFIFIGMKDNQNASQRKDCFRFQTKAFVLFS